MRSRLRDFLSNYTFWLLDVSPSLAPPFFVMGGPIMGFSAISAPEVAAELATHQPMNKVFPIHVIQSGSVSPITLSRGVRVFDGTLHDWMRSSLIGRDIPYRDLLLIHFTSADISVLGNALGGNFNASSDQAGAWTPDTVEAIRVPGRAFLLTGCLPTRYIAGQGFDAKDGEITVASIEIQPTSVIEFSLSPLDGALIAGLGSLF